MDKCMKTVQFVARFMVWRGHVHKCTTTERWDGLYKSVREGRKSTRILKTLTKVNNVFDDLPLARSPYERALIVLQHAGVGYLLHYDYLGRL